MEMGRLSDVGSDDGEIAAFKFKNVGTALEGNGLHAVQVRIGAKSSEEHARLLTIVRCVVKPALV
jgi:hypothetical protein